jgi:hypothetical protein
MDQIKKLRGCEYETDSALKTYLREFKAADGTQIADTNWRTPGEGNGGAKFLALADARTTFAERFGGTWGAVASCVGIRCDAISGISRVPCQAARSIG